MSTIYEKYRPTSFDEVVGQGKALDRISLIRRNVGFGGQAFWVSGQSGTGKTTIARLIAAEVADEFDTIEMDAVDLNLTMLQEMEEGWRYRGIGPKGGRAFIVNEAHGMRGPALTKLLTILERQPAHVVIIFTTTNDGQEQMLLDNMDSGPLMSRCHDIALSRRDLCRPFAERLREIATEMNLNGKPVEEYEKLLKRPDVKNNFRKALQLIAGGQML